MLLIWRRGDGVEVTILTWSGEIWYCAGRRLYFRRLEARDDLGALVWQAGERARRGAGLGQRADGVSGARDEQHFI